MTADAWTRELVARLLANWPTPPEPGPLRTVLQSCPEPQDPGWAPPRPAAPRAATGKQGQIVLTGTGRPVLNRAALRTLLDVTDGELDWFADRQARLSRGADGPLRHYRHRVLVSGDRVRVLEIPKPRLKEIQRRLLRPVVNRAPLHPAAHGAAPGRSVRSAVVEHAGSAVLIRCDLESFFAAITDDRVRGLLTLTGADAATVGLMTGLCTTVLPASGRRQLGGRPGDPARRRLERRLAASHLPQGAPTSPGLANAIGYRMDRRLDGLARALGGRYTRYVDDLVFSGGPGFAVGALLAGVRSIVVEEGFRLAERKTAVLRAILHNCRTKGPASQRGQLSTEQFRAQLAGKVAWVGSIDPRRGLLLSAALAGVDWDS